MKIFKELDLPLQDKILTPIQLKLTFSPRVMHSDALHTYAYSENLSLAEEEYGVTMGGLDDTDIIRLESFFASLNPSTRVRWTPLGQSSPQLFLHPTTWEVKRRELAVPTGTPCPPTQLISHTVSFQLRHYVWKRRTKLVVWNTPEVTWNTPTVLWNDKYFYI